MGSLVISPGNAQVKFGETSQFYVSAFDQNGKLMTETEEPVWTIDDALGSLDTNKGTEVMFTAADAEATGELVVSVGSITAKVTIRVVAEIIDPLIWSESFESTAVGQFPAGWTIVNAEDHETDGTTGPRVANDIPGMVGTNVMYYKTVEKGSAMQMYIEIPEVTRGRLEFSVYQPASRGSRQLDFWLSAGGALRLPNQDAVNIGQDIWHQFRFEWNLEEKNLKVYKLEGSNWVLKNGAGHTIENINVLSIDGGVRDVTSYGGVANIKLYDLDLMP